MGMLTKASATGRPRTPGDVDPGSTSPTLETIYGSLASEVRAWIRTRTGARLRARVEVDDIAQDVWLRVARSLASFDPQRGPVRSWVLRIARNTLLDLMRSAQAIPVSLDGSDSLEPGREPESAPPASSGASDWSSLPPSLRARFAALAPLDRRLLEICGLEGRPTTEAASELDLPTGTARKRWLRLRNRLARGTQAPVEGR